MRWYVAAVILLLGGIVFQIPLLTYCMYVTLAVLAASRLLARMWATQVTAERKVSHDTANMGEKVTVMVTMKNRGGLPIVWALFEDVLPRAALIFQPPRLAITGNPLQLFSLRARQGRSFIYQMQCNRRGYYQIGPLVLETGDVFGLHRRYRLLAKPHFLLVYPETLPIVGYDISSRRPIGEVRMSYRLFEDPTRIAGCRQYAQGDPLRRVHWPATARTGKLHSKIYEPTSVAGATLIMDFHQGAYPRPHEPVRSELTITAAASVAHALYQMGQQVGLITNAQDAVNRIRREGWVGDKRTRAAARRSADPAVTDARMQPIVVPNNYGEAQLQRILHTLARAELSDGLTLAQLVSELRGRLPRDATVVVLTTQPDRQAVVALGALRRQGYEVTAIVNVYDPGDFAEVAALLASERIAARHLADRAAIRTICQAHVNPWTASHAPQ